MNGDQRGQHKQRNKGNILQNSTKFLPVSVSYWTTLTSKWICLHGFSEKAPSWASFGGIILQGRQKKKRRDLL